MLNGKDLGRAIEQAINKKLASGSVKSKTEIARHFNVKLPSIYDWIKKGSISKDKLPELWNYFSDVVGPEHWGLKELHTPLKKVEPNCVQNDRQFDDLFNAYTSASAERKEIVNFLLLQNSTSEPSWVNSDTRAYITTLERQASEWLNNKENNDKPKKRPA
ncbi:hypothetical protein J0A78_14615 [Providencia rettgeri]|uniref:DNA-binding transcriptional repressor RacR n=1 Tax=Providencia TaxID=586 RepID=UPI0019D429C6|nr:MULTISPECIES: hypothetical protein [Providencia]MBN7841180.1 hypothetical protein [Providencia rettgeri]MBN7855448.1 hypothetical protein [Providencia rettgeri]MBN7863491.1 hypothetical protein [Providencia rettgeri]MBN7872703.1 hypothetical protein [Providencia rettgeri]MBN7895239.1 hypothetical protein [Providencia rettgeri]